MLKLFFKQRIGIFYTLRDLVKGRKKLRDCFSAVPFDVTFLALVISLLTVGLVMMFSASYIYAWYDKSAAFDPYYYIKKQVVFAVIGVILMIAVSFINPDIFRDASGVVMAIAFLLLVVVLITVRYFCGMRFGAGGAWRVICKNDKLRKLIRQDGRGNPSLLIALRLVPGMPVNSISGIYGSFDFGYWRFVLLSVIGFLPKLISFTLVGRNVYDPLSAGFLLPVMILLLATGFSLLSVNGVWTTVEKTIEFANKRKDTQKERKSKSNENS